MNVGFNITLISDIRLEQCQKIILHKCCVWPCVYNIAGVQLVQFQILRGLCNYGNEAVLLRPHTFTGTRALQRELLLDGAHTTQEQPAAAAPGGTTAATPPGGPTAAAPPGGTTAAASPGGTTAAASPGGTTAACAP